VVEVAEMTDCENAAIVVNGQVVMGVGDDLNAPRPLELPANPPDAPELEAVHVMEPSDDGDAPASEDALAHVDPDAELEFDEAFPDVEGEQLAEAGPDELNFDDPDDLPDVD
jgi:hypothetical protein